MHKQSQIVVTSTTQHLLNSFDRELKIKKLSKNMPEYMHSVSCDLVDNCTKIANMPQPPKKQIFEVQIKQDQKPNANFIDTRGTFKLGFIGKVNKNLIANKDKKSRSTNRGTSRNSSNYRRTTGRLSQRQKAEIIDVQQYMKIPPFEKNQLVELKKEEEDEEAKVLKENLYKRRKQEREQEEREKERLQAQKKRKKPILPRQKFTYTFNGDFLRQRQNKRRNFSISELVMEKSVELKQEKKEIPIKKSRYNRWSEPEKNYEQFGQRVRKLNIFNNSNKRQTSHLPFMKMNENVIMKQNNILNEGKSEEKITLKQFKQSNEHKHFVMYNNKETQKVIEKVEEPPKENEGRQDREETFEETPEIRSPREKPLTYLNKSFNFRHVNFPQQNSIHKYYRYDFNHDKRLYESELNSKVLSK